MTALPPDYTVNIISLVSAIDSKLLHVSLYTGRAEIRRKFEFNVQSGQNQLNITGLPNVIQKDSLRVQGHGNATIHDVSLSTTPPTPVVTTSTVLQELISKKNLLKSAIHRSKTSSDALEKYMRSITVHDVPLDQVGTFLESYNSHGGKLDEELAGLKKEEDNLYEEIIDEKARIAQEQASKSAGGLLGMQVSIGLFAESKGEIELELIYAVSSANWEAVYDIRVDLESKAYPLTLVYKAAIAQNTGEDWNNVPLTLETATPTDGVQIPSLKSLKLSLDRPPSPHYPMAAPITYPTVQPMVIVRYRRSQSRSRSPTRMARGSLSSSPHRRSRSRSPSLYHDPSPTMKSRGRTSRPRYDPPPMPIYPSTLGILGVGVLKSNGRFNNAVFQVPGLISVPCDGLAHNVTIVELNEELDIKLLWVSVPKVDTRVHLKAQIKNSRSEYTLIAGKASVYVDGTFIARTHVPTAGPDESFDCSLGIDSSIAITYHPLSSKTTHRAGFSGISSLSTFGTKTTTTLYSQRIKVHNSKRVSIDALKLLDRVPVSEDEKIVVKVVKPVELSAQVFSNRSKTQSQSQVIGTSSSGVTTLKAKVASSQGKDSSKKRDASQSEKTDDTNSIASANNGVSAGMGVGKRFSLSKPFGRKLTLSQSEDSTTELETSAGSLPSSSAPSKNTTVARIVAQWDRSNGDMDTAATDNHLDVLMSDQMERGESEPEPGKDGKMNWLLYDIPPQGTVNLLLEWQVSAVSSLEIFEREA